MYKLRNYILCVFLTIVLFFGFMAVQAIVFVNKTVIVPDTYISVIADKGVDEKIYSQIESHFEAEENATGIPASVYMDALTVDNVRNISAEKLNNTFVKLRGNNSESSLYADELAPMKSSIENFFSEYAASINYSKDDVYYSKIDSVYNDAEKFILDTADVYQFSEIEKAGYLKYLEKLIKYADKALIASIGFLAFLLIILITANRKKISGIFYWLSVSIGLSSAFYLAVCIYFKATDYFSQFAIKAQHIFAAFTGTLNTFTDSLIMINIILVFISIVFMIIFLLFSKEKVSEK